MELAGDLVAASHSNGIQKYNAGKQNILQTLGYQAGEGVVLHSGRNDGDVQFSGSSAEPIAVGTEGAAK